MIDVRYYLSVKVFFTGFCIGFIATLFLNVWKTEPPKLKYKPPTTSKSTKSKKAKGECKMVLLVRKDLKATKREIAAYCVQACLGAYHEAVERQPGLVTHWNWNGAAKIALKVNDEAELIHIKEAADNNYLVNHLRQDRDPSRRSALVLAIGPDRLELEIKNDLWNRGLNSDPCEDAKTDEMMTMVQKIEAFIAKCICFNK